MIKQIALAASVASMVFAPTAADARHGHGSFSVYSGYGNGYGGYGNGYNDGYGNDYGGYGQQSYGSNYNQGYYDQNYNQGYYGQGYNQGYSNHGYYGQNGYNQRDYGRNRCGSGTTGLIVGGAAGALIGREVSRSGNRNSYHRNNGTAGALIGGALGALAGRSIGRSC